MTEKELPVIDLRLAHGNTRPALVKKLREAMTTVGFIYLTGLSDFDDAELLRLSRWFFAIPLEERMKISKKTFSPTCDYEYRGFFPVIPGAVSHKEALEMGPYLEQRPNPPSENLGVRMFFEDNQWPNPAGDQNTAKYFRKWMENYHKKMTDASLELLRLIAEGFDAPTEFFTPLFEYDHLSTLRLIHYPARPNPPESARDGDYVIQTAEHNDTGVITLLATFEEYPGLQVRWWEDDSLLDVPYRKGHLVVNIGNVLSSISGGRLKATRHRVVDLCGDRLSVPFFLEPRFGGNINVALPGGTPKLGYDPEEVVEYGPWLFKNMTRFAEYKDLVERVAKEGTAIN
ncbi:uncharacterized protein LOC135226964 [Macrobrachium nipponense]|uniref:uncharacterized protein LOC135226964 n=1 Tax=Macrobrachium nipponense TaxID=159736 RepID=UPI0030C8705B